jgi:hypothetical protein
MKKESLMLLDRITTHKAKESEKKEESKDKTENKDNDKDSLSTDDNSSLIGFEKIGTSANMKTSSAQQLFSRLRQKGQHYETELALLAAISSNGAAQAAGVVKFDPSGTTDWSSFSSIFDEFRVVQLDVHVAGTWKWDLNKSHGFVICAGDNDDDTTPSTGDDVAQYVNSRFHEVGSEWSYSYRRPDLTPSAYWVDVASPATSLGGIKFATSNTPVSITALYGLKAVWHIQFRSRR